MEDNVNLIAPDQVLPPPPKSFRKFWLVTAIVFALLALITIVSVITTVLILKKPASTPETSPQPTIIITPTPVPTPSKFATDAGILKIQADLKLLLGKIDSVDFFQTEITPPNLDLNIRVNP